MTSCRKLAKSTLVNILDRFGYFTPRNLTERIHNLGGVLVLAYHSVHPDPKNDPVFADTIYSVPEHIFAAQMAALQRHLHIIGFAEFQTCILGGKKLPDRACLITFDDGWSDNFSCAWPVLSAKKIPALFFLATDLVGTDNLEWTQHLWRIITLSPQHVPDILKKIKVFSKDEKYKSTLSTKTPLSLSSYIFSKISTSPSKERKTAISIIIDSDREVNTLPPPPFYMTWEQLRRIDNSLITVGSHGHKHYPLTWFEDHELDNDLCQSHTILNREGFANISSFSYPHSLLTPREEKAVARAGFTFTFAGNTFNNTSWKTNTNTWRVPRVGSGPQTGIGAEGTFSDTLFLYDLLKQTPGATRIFSR